MSDASANSTSISKPICGQLAKFDIAYQHENYSTVFGGKVLFALAPFLAICDFSLGLRMEENCFFKSLLVIAVFQMVSVVTDRLIKSAMPNAKFLQENIDVYVSASTGKVSLVANDEA